MIQVVINYDTGTKEYKFYEPTTDTILISMSLTEGLINLNEFLKTQNLVTSKKGILGQEDISYILDSYTFKSIIDSNVNLMKRISSGPSEFKISSSKFGQSGSGGIPGGPQGKKMSDFGGKKSNFSSGTFGSSNSGFKKSAGKLGSKGKY